MDPKKKSLEVIKYALDAIEELRQLYPDGTKRFKTHSSKLIGYSMTKNDFDALLQKIQSKKIAVFLEKDNGLRWGENSLEILVVSWDKFDEYRNYVTDELKKMIAPTAVVNKRTSIKADYSKYWNYVNPLWITWKLSLLAWRHKIWTVVISAIGILGFDYSMAWKNLRWIWSFLNRQP